MARFTQTARRLAWGAAVLALTAIPGTLPAGTQSMAPLGLPLEPIQGSAATLNVAPNATGEQLRDASLRQLGWTETAVSYVGGPRPDGRARVLLTYLPNQQVTCKADWACLTGYFPGVERVQITIDPADGLFARGFAHEYGHAMDNARGYSDSIVGNVLYDLLELSQDRTHPEANWGARQILQLRDDDGDRANTLGYHTMLDHSDFSHLSIALLEFGVGNDPAKLPDWFRQAYYPYLQPTTPRLARAVPVPIDIVPGDIAVRTQRVVDLIAQLCGPSLPGAQTKPATTCASHTRPWPDVPYAPYPGASGTGPAAPGIPHAPIVDAVPVAAVRAVVAPAAPGPVSGSHVADQGVSIHPAASVVVAIVTPPVATQSLFVLPQTQLGQSVDEGTILTPSDAIGQAYYFIADGQRFNLTEAEVVDVMSASPLTPLFSAARDRIAQYPEAAPPSQGTLGLLEGLDTLPSPLPADDQ